MRIDVDLEQRKYEHALKSKSINALRLEMERCELTYRYKDSKQSLYFTLTAHHDKMLKTQARLEQELCFD